MERPCVKCSSPPHSRHTTTTRGRGAAVQVPNKLPGFLSLWRRDAWAIQARASKRFFRPVSSASRTGLELLLKVASGLYGPLDLCHSREDAAAPFCRRSRQACGGLARCRLVGQSSSELETDRVRALGTPEKRANTLVSCRDNHFYVPVKMSSSRQWLSRTTRAAPPG